MNLCTVGTVIHYVQNITKRIRLNGMIDPANKGPTSVCDVYEPIPDDIEHFGVDHGGPLP